MSYSDNHVCSQQFFFVSFGSGCLTLFYIYCFCYSFSLSFQHMKKQCKRKWGTRRKKTPFALSNSWLSVLGNFSTSFFNHFVLLLRIFFFFSSSCEYISCFVFTLFGNDKLRCAYFVYGSADKSSLRHIFSIYGHYINRFFPCPLCWPVYSYSSFKANH